MLAFGIKVAWFSLSLAGLLGSFTALPAFAQALDGYLIPILYFLYNLVLQALFCLGMIWKMNPAEMPHGFCILQPILMGVSWNSLVSLTAWMSITLSLSIFRASGDVLSYTRRYRQWRWTYMLFGLLPLAALVAYIILALKFGAIRQADGMNCDANDPVWVRLLSYAGAPLLLAFPSLLMVTSATFRLYIRTSYHRHSFIRSRDNFTHVPIRRQPKQRPSHPWQEAKSSNEIDMAALSPTDTGRSAENASVTPSGTIVGDFEVIPTPPDSISSSARARMIAGRAPVSPGAMKPGMRYHLPFQWHPPSPRDSFGPLRDSIDIGTARQTPSPLVFAFPVDESGQVPNTTVSITPDLDIAEQRIYDAAPWLKDEKAYMRQIEFMTARRNGDASRSRSRSGPYDAVIADEDEDDVSSSLRWVRRLNDDDNASTMKSELEFARSPAQDEFDRTTRRPSPRDASTYDTGSSEQPIPNSRRLVWRLIFFLLLSSTAQIVATLSSLIVIFMSMPNLPPLGTHHVGLLIVAWAPVVSFGAHPAALWTDFKRWLRQQWTSRIVRSFRPDHASPLSLSL
ncbi:uncharacterized protein BXZ73DRAFT_53622 [Epithele typhae]|uniref:uncharacterized protein n=1 Tax=Epithele typhae TaxID=378194 RepID=UPI0020079009|nr:uncharacterized protein BXZ73DRAFT_53622 [Epithele typhae]KAH9916724.1 hypothetical protein BXZ73DRAFT_53622 [Epithele typhae]